MYLLDEKPTRVGFASRVNSMVNHNNFADRMALRRRRFIQISALSTFDGRIEAYHGFNGWRRIRVEHSDTSSQEQHAQLVTLHKWQHQRIAGTSLELLTTKLLWST